MNISRRSLLGASGVAAAYPFIGGLTSMAALDQPAANEDPSPQLSKDLLDYVSHSTGQLAAGIHQKSVRSHHLLAGSRKLHLLANHIRELGVDDALRPQIAATDLSQLDLNTPIDRTKVTQFFQNYDPTLTVDDLPPQRRHSLDHMISAKSRLQRVGLSGHFHDLADAMHLAGKFLASYPQEIPASSPSPSLNTPRVQLANWQPAHVVPVQLWKKCGFKTKQNFCEALDLASSSAAAAGILINRVCAVAGVTLALIFIWNPAVTGAIATVCLGEADVAAAAVGLVIGMFHYMYC